MIYKWIASAVYGRIEDPQTVEFQNIQAETIADALELVKERASTLGITVLITSIEMED